MLARLLLTALLVPGAAVVCAAPASAEIAAVAAGTSSDIAPLTGYATEDGTLLPGDQALGDTADLQPVAEVDPALDANPNGQSSYDAH